MKVSFLIRASNKYFLAETDWENETIPLLVKDNSIVIGHTGEVPVRIVINHIDLHIDYVEGTEVCDVRIEATPNILDEQELREALEEQFDVEVFDSYPVEQWEH